MVKCLESASPYLLWRQDRDGFRCWVLHFRRWLDRNDLKVIKIWNKVMFPFTNYRETSVSQQGSPCLLLVPPDKTLQVRWLMKHTERTNGWETRREVLFSLSACRQTQPPPSSTPEGVMTNSWGGRLFSNPNGNGDVQTACYYLRCSWSEPRYLATHSPTVSHTHFSLLPSACSATYRIMWLIKPTW